MNSIVFIQIIVGLGEMFIAKFPYSQLLISETETAQKKFDVSQELYKDQLPYIR